MKGERVVAQVSWPWRGLAVAALLAVLVHIAALMLTQSRFAFSFQSPAQTAALNTRMIAPVPELLQKAAPEPQRPREPEQRRAQSPKPEKTPIAAQKAPVERDAPVEPAKIEPIQPAAVTETAQSATETIATVPISPPSDQVPNTAGAGSAAPGLKLAYPGSAKLQFDGTFSRKGSAQTGSGVLSWAIDGTSYVLSLEATALIVLSQTETSLGALSPQGLSPQTYSSKRTGRSEQATHFRREIERIQFSNNKPDAVLMVGAQDRLSALVQLAGIIGGDPERYRIVNRIQMQVAGLDKAEIWEFNLEGISDINVPAANMQALKLSRTPRDEFDQRLEIWLSPQLGYLPIRIRQSSATTPSEDFTDLVLRKLP